MTASSAEHAYRATFEEYTRKLDTLQRLMSSGASNSNQIESALLEVEKARLEHSRARDVLAGKWIGPELPPLPSVNERHIRETARLLWEVAGRPDGTAECDWQRAEQVHKAASLAC
jgi:hypothetical protein